MRKLAVLIGLTLLLTAPLSRAAAATMEEPGQLPPDRIQMPDKSQEDDCDCCQKCEAARRPVVPKEEAGSSKKKNGCEDCCARCGRPLPNAPQQSPPDIIDKPK
jgi:hypothetical protein